MFPQSDVTVNGGTFNSVAGNYNVQITDGPSKGEAGFKQLYSSHVAEGALHNSGEVSDQPKCHPGTRVAILEHLAAWAMALTYAYPMIWLHGPAGSGKSSILRTIAQLLSDQNHLLASFFFFRSAAGRNRSDHFITTIAFQLALSIPETRPYIGAAVEKNPLIFSRSLWDQAQDLIVSPILAVCRDVPSCDFSQFPRVIVIDGLDECNDPDKQCGILKVLCRILQDLPIPVAVLMASRPEYHIRREFDMPGRLNTSSSRLSLDNSYNPDADIKKYLNEKFNAIAMEPHHQPYLPSPWPSPHVIQRLVDKASGQFIYVSTVVKFINSPGKNNNPAKRLDIILGAMDAGKLKPFEELDTLYSIIFLNISESDRADVLRVLGLLLVPDDPPRKFGGKPFTRTPAFLERLLNLETGDIRRMLFDMESLLTVGHDNEAVLFYHASLGDYLFDQSRSGQFWIDTGLVYADFAQHCTIQMSQSKSWPELKQFFYHSSHLFFSKATPTLGLRNAIEHSDIARVVDFSYWRYYEPFDALSNRSDLTPTVLQAISHSAFPDANNIYIEKLCLYAQIIRPRIRIYSSSTRLRYLFIAAASLLAEHADTESERKKHCTALQSIFEISRETWTIQKFMGLNLESSSIALMQLIKSLLDGVLDSNGYFVESDEYADIAIFLMESLITDRRSYTGLEKHEILECMFEIFPTILSKSSARQDLLNFVKKTLIHPTHLDIRVEDALKAYVSRSTADWSSVIQRWNPFYFLRSTGKRSW